MKKKKILLAFAMLLLSAAALTTASYAWFTANTRITLGQLDVKVQATNGIQVSTDATNWKATLTTDELKGAIYDGTIIDSTNQFPNTLTPVSTIGSTTAGIFDMYYGVLNDDASLTLTKEADVQDLTGAVGKYVAFDIFISSTSTTPREIGLLPSSSVTVLTPNSGAANDTGLKYSARVGFLNKGTDANSSAAAAYNLNTSVEYKIWEPNAEAHTVASTATANTTYAYRGAIATGTSVSTGAGNTTNFAAITAANLLLSDVAQTKIINSTGANAAWEPSSPASWTSTESTGYPTLFSVPTGYTKVRIYIWIEGQDIDCENSASLGTGISVTLNLNAK